MIQIRVQITFQINVFTKDKIKLRTNRFGDCVWLSNLSGGWGVTVRTDQSFSHNFVGFYSNSIYIFFQF